MTQATGSDSRPIIAGIDGSASSVTALTWAYNQAKLTGAPLEVVSTWRYPTSYGLGEFWPPDFNFETEARRVLEECVNEVIGAESKAKVTMTLVEGHPAQILAEKSKGASLIVVGSRGHGEFAGMLLGSVGEFLAAHAHCPVAIIRSDKVKGA